MSEFVIDSVGPDRGPEIRRPDGPRVQRPPPVRPRRTTVRPRIGSSARSTATACVGTVMTHEFSQVFGGRAVPCGGVAGVTVAPDARGRGLARRMLVESFVRMRIAVRSSSSLYPTTSPLYGGLGYGVAGEFAHRRVPLRGHRAGAAARMVRVRVRLRRDACGPAIRGLPARRVGARRARRGGTTRPGDDPARPPTGSSRGSVAATTKPVAVVVYTYGKDERTLYDLRVQLLAGIDAAGRALCAVVPRSRTARPPSRSTPRCPARSSTSRSTRPELAKVESDWPWMLRIVDLDGAIAAPGLTRAAS